MASETRIYSFPRWRIIRWLVDAGSDVPKNIRVALIGNLFGTLPVFAAGVANTLAVSALIAVRVQTAPFVAWLVIEILICAARLTVLLKARQAALKHRRTPTDIYLVLGIAWSVSVGYGALISLASRDWIAATLACVSAAAMAGGICFRHFSAPRLAGTMIVTSLGLCLPGAALSGEPLFYFAFAQVPMYLVAMTMAAFKLNRMLIATMRAERENDHRARHDHLTGLSNRTGLVDAIETRLKSPIDDNQAFALLFLDLDNFKMVNDSFGHAAGDRLLKLVAGRIRQLVRPSDLVARIGGDEFLVLADGLTGEQALELGQRLISGVATLYDLGDGISTRVGLSIGIATAPEHGRDFASLVAVADAALYKAKSSGKLRCCMGSCTAISTLSRRLRGNTGTGADVAA
jgi:diguanylate cyclase (GGDEF)-like protein